MRIASRSVLLHHGLMMKPVRLMLTFLLLSMAIVCSLWISGLMEEGEVADTLRRTIGIIGIIGSVLIAAFYTLKTSKRSDNNSKADGPGPQF